MVVFNDYNGLANRRFQPLSHVSAKSAVFILADKPTLSSGVASNRAKFSVRRLDTFDRYAENINECGKSLVFGLDAYALALPARVFPNSFNRRLLFTNVFFNTAKKKNN